MKKIALYLLILFSFLFVSSTVEAAVTTYSNRVSYDAAAAGYGMATNIDFLTKDDLTPITVPANDVSIDPLTLRGTTFNGARSFYNGWIYTFPTATITANLPPNTYAFGVDLSSSYGLDGTYTVNLSDGSTYHVVRTGSTVFFFGAVSNTPIQWANFTFDSDYEVLDNFTFTATPTYNIADGDVNGLIAAINAANAHPGGDIINLATGGTYTLTGIVDNDSYHGPTGLPVVNGQLTINGNGATIQRSSASGMPDFRVFHSLFADIVLDSVIIRGGRGYGSIGGGGGLYLNQTRALLRNSTVTDNYGLEGGGIFNTCSALTIENSTISNNTGFGGRTGGGILNFGGYGCDTTISISNSTVYDNRADGNPGFEGRGDAIANAFTPPGSIVVKNSIIASPTRGAGADCAYFTPDSRGHNIFSDNSCGQNVAGGYLIVPDLALGPLVNNGGPTPTHSLLAGSSAIDAIPIVDCTTISGSAVLTDQRGIARPVGAGCDIGAYESDVTFDSTPPIIAPTLTGILGNDNWYTSDVYVSWAVTDGESPVSSSSGCDAVSVTADTTGTTFTCTATSGGGTSTQSVTIKRDATAPAISCGSADGAWHAADVSIACNNGDPTSGLAVAGDASFSLSTSVAAGTETANAATDSRTVCDNAGNCAAAGPIGSNKIDKKAPTIAITAPVAGNYLLNQAVTDYFTCTDGGSGVANCLGTSVNGSLLDTGSAGAKTFTVSSTDNVGNASSTTTVNYTVNFGVTALFDQTKANKSGSTVPIKIRLVDANGANVSSVSTVVHAISVIQVSSQASTILDDAGSSNPDFDFRYDASLGGYIFNLKTTGYGTGGYLLNFVVGNSPTVYSVGFQVRQ